MRRAVPASAPLSSTGVSGGIRRRSLLTLIRLAQVRLLLVVLLTATLPLALMTAAVVDRYARQNLELTARSVAYTVEAAVVFRDDRAAEDDLRQIADREGVLQARIDDAQGRAVARYQRRDASHAAHAIAVLVARRWWSEPVTAPIVHAGREVGRVSVWGDPAMLVELGSIGLAGIAISLLWTSVAWRLLMGRLRRDVVRPLDELIDVTRAARQPETSHARARPSLVAELDELSTSFNAMLDRIEAHEASMQRENETLARQALHDSLTGLPNRAYFNQRLALAYEAARRDGTRLAVLVLDSNDFKAVNDVYGHAGGDRVLAETARRVRELVRETDVVARVGGDEFVVLLAPLRQVADAERIAVSIMEAMDEPVVLIDGTRIDTSVSVGLAVYPDHADSVDALMHAADQSMYRAKKSGRGGHALP